MKRAAQRYPAREFSMPEGLKRVEVDPIEGWRLNWAEDGISVLAKEESRIPREPFLDLRRLRGFMPDTMRSFRNWNDR